MSYHSLNDEQYLGPAALALKKKNKNTSTITEFISNFVAYEKHSNTLSKLSTMLEGGTWGSVIADVCYHGGLDHQEEGKLYELLDKAEEEIRRRMKVFEQDQLVILKNKP